MDAATTALPIADAEAAEAAEAAIRPSFEVELIRLSQGQCHVGRHQVGTPIRGLHTLHIA